MHMAIDGLSRRCAAADPRRARASPAPTSWTSRGFRARPVMQRARRAARRRSCWSSSPKPARRAAGAGRRRSTFNERVGVVLAADLGARARAARGLRPGRRRAGRAARRRCGSRTGRRWCWTGSSAASTSCWSRPERAGRDVLGDGDRRPGPGRGRAGRPVDAADHARLGRLPGRRAAVRALRRAGAARARRQRDGARRAPSPLAASSSHMVFVKVATGIGAGIIAGGELLRGNHGRAGDIGHIRALPGIGRAVHVRQPRLRRGAGQRLGDGAPAATRRASRSRRRRTSSTLVQAGDAGRDAPRARGGPRAGRRARRAWSASSRRA